MNINNEDKTVLNKLYKLDFSNFPYCILKESELKDYDSIIKNDIIYTELSKNKDLDILEFESLHEIKPITTDCMFETIVEIKSLVEILSVTVNSYKDIAEVVNEDNVKYNLRLLRDDITYTYSLIDVIKEKLDKVSQRHFEAENYIDYMLDHPDFIPRKSKSDNID